jgi:hypothetical protein
LLQALYLSKIQRASKGLARHSSLQKILSTYGNNEGAENETENNEGTGKE